MKKKTDTQIRAGCKDIWNAYMCQNAVYDAYDIPICPTTATILPKKIITVLSPHTIVVYGSANYPCFEKLIDRGIKVISYPSQMAQAFGREKQDE